MFTYLDSGTDLKILKFELKSFHFKYEKSFSVISFNDGLSKHRCRLNNIPKASY